MEFAIKPCQVGDERRLSLLGKATFLETYAGNTEAADLLDFVEAEHSAEVYKLWLESDFAKIWIAETIPAHFWNWLRSSPTPITWRPRCRDQASLRFTPFPAERIRASTDE